MILLLSKRGWLSLVNFIVNVHSILLIPVFVFVCVWLILSMCALLFVSVSVYVLFYGADSRWQMMLSKWQTIIFGIQLKNRKNYTSFMAGTSAIHMFRIEAHSLYIVHCTQFHYFFFFIYNIDKVTFTIIKLLL